MLFKLFNFLRIPKLKKILTLCARSDVFFYLVIWLIILLISGTIAEQQQGLYYAQQNYFSVYFFWVFGLLPLPGAYTTLTAIFLNLLCKLSTDNWQIKKLGTLVTHISGLLLLLGGFLTAHFSQEGYMDITENSTVNYFNDYHETELVITDLSNIKDPKVNILSQNDILAPKNSKNIADLPNLSITVLDYCKHCRINQKELLRLAKPKDNEQATPAVALKLQFSLNNKAITTYYAYLTPFISGSTTDNKNPYTIQIDNKRYSFELRFKRTFLPFSITLNKFSQELHPGTEIAREYSSDVTLNDNAIDWHGVISMNQPLRYKGYTFYQASFYQEGEKYTTVLAAVYNIGQNFPYIASIILCFGILIHLMQKFPKLFKTNNS